MGFCHYFSSDEDKRARFIFNLIAPVYGLFDHSMLANFIRLAKKLNVEVPLESLSVLDIGTGTGAWIAALNHLKIGSATGIDSSGKMIHQARKKHPGIQFKVAEASDLGEFKDRSFDVVTSSFMLHGIKKEGRITILAEMKRIAEKAVVVHDFYKKASPAIRILEFLERSDYKNFVKNFEAEFSTFFRMTKLLTDRYENGIYVGFKSVKL